MMSYPPILLCDRPLSLSLTLSDEGRGDKP